MTDSTRISNQAPQLSGTQKLLKVMEALRTPETGCPWDLEQTSQSLIPYILEEAYEVVAAIESEDSDQIRDELGDLLLQVVYQAQISQERGGFDFDEIAQHVAEKMIARHPHVFGSETVASVAEQSDRWEQLKARERQTAGDSSALSGIVGSLPALTRALKLQKRAARLSFDWPHIQGVLSKMAEEITELESALETSDLASSSEELGDILFTAVNLARHLDIDPETALRSANHKFERRFREMENISFEEATQLSKLSPEQFDHLWRRAKERLSGT